MIRDNSIPYQDYMDSFPHGRTCPKCDCDLKPHEGTWIKARNGNTYWMCDSCAKDYSHWQRIADTTPRDAGTESEG